MKKGNASTKKATKGSTPKRMAALVRTEAAREALRSAEAALIKATIRRCENGRLTAPEMDRIMWTGINPWTLYEAALSTNDPEVVLALTGARYWDRGDDCNLELMMIGLSRFLATIFWDRNCNLPVALSMIEKVRDEWDDVYLERFINETGIEVSRPKERLVQELKDMGRDRYERAFPTLEELEAEFGLRHGVRDVKREIGDAKVGGRLA